MAEKEEKFVIRELITPIPPEVPEARRWEVWINGERVLDVAELELRSRFGVWRYGMGLAGYPLPAHEEPGGGGSVSVPFVVIAGELFLGVVHQSRFLQDEAPTVDNVPRGFLDPGEKHFATAVREGAEEMGIQEAERYFRLDESGHNPNSANTVTRGRGRGVAFFGVRFLPEEVEPNEGGAYRFKPGVLRPVSKQAELIMGSTLVHWSQIGCLDDGFSTSALGHLQAYLFGQGKLQQTVTF